MQPSREDQPLRPAPSNPVRIELGGTTLTLLLAVVGVIWLAGRLSHLLLILLFAILLATAIDEPVGWLERRGIPRGVGILLHYLAIVLLLAGVVVVLIPLVRSEITLLRQELPVYAANLETYIAKVSPGHADFSVSEIANQGSSRLDDVASRVTQIGIAAAETIVYVFITLVLAFFLAADSSTVGRLIARFAPVSRQEQIRVMAATSRDRIGGWARGQLLIALLFGLAMGIGLKLLGVPYAASLGATAAVLEIFPYVGGAITVVLATLTALSVDVPRAVAVIVLYIILVNLEAHVLSPLLFGRAIGLPPVAILIALLAGVDLLGVAGALLAVPVVVILWVIVEQIWPGPLATVENAPTGPVVSPPVGPIPPP